MEQQFLFKSSFQGVSKKNGKPFHIIELHNSLTLENSQFFIPEGVTINVDGMVIRDKVVATLEMAVSFGKPVVNLLLLKKV